VFKELVFKKSLKTKGSLMVKVKNSAVNYTLTIRYVKTAFRPATKLFVITY